MAKAGANDQEWSHSYVVYLLNLAFRYPQASRVGDFSFDGECSIVWCWFVLMGYVSSLLRELQGEKAFCKYATFALISCLANRTDRGTGCR